MLALTATTSRRDPCPGLAQRKWSCPSSDKHTVQEHQQRPPGWKSSLPSCFAGPRQPWGFSFISSGGRMPPCSTSRDFEPSVPVSWWLSVCSYPHPFSARLCPRSRRQWTAPAPTGFWRRDVKGIHPQLLLCRPSVCLSPLVCTLSTGAIFPPRG